MQQSVSSSSFRGEGALVRRQITLGLLVSTILSSCDSGASFSADSAETVDSDIAAAESRDPVEANPNVEFADMDRELDANPILEVTPPATAPSFALNCEAVLASTYETVGSHSCPDCPSIIEDTSGYSKNMTTSVLDVSSRVVNFSGSGIWCLQSLSGEGANSGVPTTATDGSFSQKIPLFCGDQKLAFGWQNESGLGKRGRISSDINDERRRPNVHP